MVVAQDFGMEDVMEIIIVSKHKKNVKMCVLNHLVEVYKHLDNKPSYFLYYIQLKTFIYIDVCYLPKSVGPCEGYYPTWYYDQERKQCAQFVYGGCLGNNNKFQTREECEHLCVVPDTLGNK